MQYTTIVKNESIWCIETDGKDAYNSQKKTQYHIYNMIHYVLKKKSADKLYILEVDIHKCQKIWRAIQYGKLRWCGILSCYHLESF